MATLTDRLVIIHWVATHVPFYNCTMAESTFPHLVQMLEALKQSREAALANCLLVGHTDDTQMNTACKTVNWRCWQPKIAR